MAPVGLQVLDQKSFFFFSQELKKRDVSKDKNINKKQIFPLHKPYFFPSHMQFFLLRTFRNEADDIAKINMKMIAVEEY